MTIGQINRELTVSQTREFLNSSTTGNAPSAVVLKFADDGMKAVGRVMDAYYAIVNRSARAQPFDAQSLYDTHAWSLRQALPLTKPWTPR
jgi:hypothetical protein